MRLTTRLVLLRVQFHKDIDSFLTDAQRSESFAYRSMISEKLHRVMVRSLHHDRLRRDKETTAACARADMDV